MRKMIRTRTFVAGLAIWLFAAPRAGWSAESDVEDLKREVRALSAQVQALRAAIAEAAELDKQRAAVLSRALKSSGNTVEPAASATSFRIGLGPPATVTVAPTSGVFRTESMTWVRMIPWLWPAYAPAPGYAAAPPPEKDEDNRGIVSSPMSKAPCLPTSAAVFGL